MSKSLSNLPKDAGKGAKTGGKKEGGGNNMILIILAAVAVIAVVIGLMTGGGDKEDAKKKTEENVSVAGATSGAPGAKVYEGDARRTVERSDPANANGFNGVNDLQQVNQNELVYKTDPTTGVSLVQTPAGFVEADSPAGQKFIDDFNKMKAMQNPNAVNAAAPQISQQQLDEIKQYNDSQIRALDEKLNDLAGQLESSVQLIKKQNETIVHLSTQIKSIQPIVKSPNELAKELFGKEGSRVLKSRNNSLKAEVVIGDKAFISDKNGNIHALQVGDVVPNTSSIVSSIDAATKTVTVRH